MVSVWAGAAWILVWGQQECPAAGQSFFSKNVTDSDKRDGDEAPCGCRDLQLPFFSFQNAPQNLFY